MRETCTLPPENASSPAESNFNTSQTKDKHPVNESQTKVGIRDHLFRKD